MGADSRTIAAASDRSETQLAGMPLSTKPRGCLYDAVAEIAEKSGTVNPRILGRWIEKKRGKDSGRDAIGSLVSER